jgi:diacylglycerol O-acyltransferase / wax synthase
VKGHTLKVIVVDGVHDLEAVRRHVAAGLAAVPRLLQRLAPTPLRLAPPLWVDDPAFDLDDHVHAGPATAALHDAGLHARLAELMTQRLPLDRPPWDLEVLPLEGERTALVWRVHHCMADGHTAMVMLDRFLLDDHPKAPRPPVFAWEPDPPPPPARLLALAMRDRVSAAGRAVRRAVSSTEGWRMRVAGVRRLATTLRRELSRGGAETALDHPAGPRREVTFVSASLPDLKAIGHGAPERATVNDVVLAAAAGGLRRWLAEQGAGAKALRVKVPVSLHHGDAGPANRDSFMCVDLPLEEQEPVLGLAAVAHETRERKEARDAETMDTFFRDVSHLSRSMERYAERWAESPRVFALSVSNVPGPAEPRWVLGSPLLELHSVAEIGHRHALRVSVVSACGRLSFGLCADPEAVGDLRVVADGIVEELDALRMATSRR